MELTENTLVADRFRLVRKLGEGGMGSVWLARHEHLGTQCAVKFIHADVADATGVRERFHREAKIAAQLKSPYVVGVLDYGVWSGDPYLAMEYLEGEDLGQRLDARKRLAPVETFTIVAQVARALAKAHAAGLVHRDLKPENVFLTREDDGERVKVLDFGIAKTLSNSVNVQTQTGAMLGTPRFMSPEQAEGKKTVDHRSDLWALGVIVYRCLVGQLPFDSDALGDLLMRIMVHPLPMPSQFAPGLPPALDAWWTKAAARNPDQRFQSANELVDALGHALGLANTPRVSTPSLDLAFAATSSPMSAPMTTPQAPIAMPPQGAIAHTPYPAPGPTINDPRFATNPTQMTPAPVPHVTMSTASRTFHGGEPKRRGSAAPLIAIAFLAIGAIGAGAYVFMRHAPSDATADSAAPTTIPLPSSTAIAAAPTLAPDPTDKPVVAPAPTTLASSPPIAQPIRTVTHPQPPPTPRPARTGKVHIGG